MAGKPFQVMSCQERVALTPQLTDELGPVGKKEPQTQPGWMGRAGGLGSQLVPTQHILLTAQVGVSLRLWTLGGWTFIRHFLCVRC